MFEDVWNIFSFADRSRGFTRFREPENPWFVDKISKVYGGVTPVLTRKRMELPRTAFEGYELERRATADSETFAALTRAKTRAFFTADIVYVKGETSKRSGRFSICVTLPRILSSRRDINNNYYKTPPASTGGGRKKKNAQPGQLGSCVCVL